MKAETLADAREKLKNSPFFDCIILLNHSENIDMSNLNANQFNAIQKGFVDFDGYFNNLFSNL